MASVEVFGYVLDVLCLILVLYEDVQGFGTAAFGFTAGEAVAVVATAEAAGVA